MCGIVGAVSTRNIVPILVQGLQRLEYRGYDSCGVAVHAASLGGDATGGLRRSRSTSRVAELMEQVSAERLEGGTGIAHTRWATHGAPAVHNAHPHFSHGAGAGAGARAGRAAACSPSMPAGTGPRLTCGCALATAGAPCVAQRVWAMPVPPANPCASACAARSATRAMPRRRRNWVAGAALAASRRCTATPQES